MDIDNNNSAPDSKAKQIVDQHLFGLSVVEPYSENIFRQLSIATDAGVPTIRRAAKKQKIRQSREGNGAAASKFLNSGISSENSTAMEAIRDPAGRLIAELFWFWNAFDVFANNDPITILARLEQASDSSVQSTNNIHDLAIIHHVLALDTAVLKPGAHEQKLGWADVEAMWKSAYCYWRQVVDSPDTWDKVRDRIADIDDSTLSESIIDPLRTTLPEYLLTIHVQIALEVGRDGNIADANRHGELIRNSGFEETSIQNAIRRGIVAFQKQLSSISNSANARTKADAKEGADAANTLIHATAPILASLDAVLGPDHALRHHAFNLVAESAHQAVRDYTMETSDWERGKNALVIIATLATDAALVKKIDDDLESIEEIKVDSCCWFCGSAGSPAESKHNFPVQMHGDIVRTPTAGGIRVNWNHRKLIVRRCEHCAQTHAECATRRSLSAMSVCTVLGALVGVYFAPFLFAPFFHAATGAVIGGIVGVAIGAMASDGASAGGIKPANQTNAAPEIKEMLKKGWSFGKEPVTD